FAITQHVDNLLAACAQTLFALRTLRQHGLPTSALHTIFHATVIAKLCHASPAWWGFTSAADRNRLEAFLRRSAQFGYRDASAQTLSDICEQVDKRLFDNIIRNDKHLLHPLLPPQRSQHYSVFGSDPTTTKSLCAHWLSTTIIFLQEYCLRHNFTVQSMTRL